MNRIQFFILTGISAVVLILMALNIYLSHSAFNAQSQAYAAQQNLTTGERFRNVLTTVVQRINVSIQKDNNQALKDLLARQKISTQAPAPGATAPASTSSTNSTDSPAAPASH
jgi:hypothetical protein